MRLLGVRDRPRVRPGPFGHGLGAVDLGRLCARRLQGRLRQRHRVGAHVRDVAVLVQLLGDPHRRLRGEAELAARLLLEGRRSERRRRPARVRRLLDRADREGAIAELVRQPPGPLLVEDDDLGARLSVRAEVASLGDPAPVDGGERCLERARLEGAQNVPVAGGDEAHALALALHDEPRRDRLDASCREPLRHLLPEHGRDLVAVEAVEDPARLLRVDEPVVDVSRLLERPLDRLACDLVEDHATHRHLRLQRLDEVVGDRLALAVLIRREQELVGVLELALQVRDHLLLVRVDEVVGLEALRDRDAERAVLGTVGLRDVRGPARQVANVADARLDHVVGAEVTRDGLGLRRALDDHQLLA